MQIAFTNLRVSGSMTFDGLSFDGFRQLMDYIDRLTGGTPDEPEVTEPAPEIHDEPIVPAGMDFPGGVPVHVYEKPEDMEPAKPEEDDPYAKVKNYTGKVEVVRILKDATEHPDQYKREWLTTPEWMERVCLGSSAASYTVGLILSDIVKLGLLDRKEGYNSEVQKYERRYYLPIPITSENSEADEVPAVTTLDSRRGAKVRSARMEAGISVPELADLLHTDVGTVIKWEAGVYRIAGSVEDDLKKLFGNGLFEDKEVQ